MGRTLREAIAHDALRGLEIWSRANGTRIPISDVTFLPVIPDAGKILCIGINYRAHVLETGRELPSHPMVFTRFADSQTAHDAPLVLPDLSTKFDFEGELAVVIGRPAWRVKAADALRHVAGYACYNDGSARDWQKHSSQFTAGKNFPGTGAFGPWLVTPDELGDPGTLELTARVNGEVMQHASLDDLIFDIPALIEYCSAFTVLRPGDVLVTGTPGGVGAFRTRPLWLADGDIVEVEISRIGTLRNRVSRELQG